MSQHSSALRLADAPDKAAVLAEAMRAVTDDPASPGARKELDAAVLDCTSQDYETAWGIAHPQETRAEYQGPPPGARMLPIVRAECPGTPAAPEVSAPASAPRDRRRWPLFVIASPAAVAIWSGWVALGAMCGFGPVNLLPGIGSGFTVNTAITLPVGVEAYGAYALGAWLLPGAPERARRFARRSAVGALVLGMTGQVIYHLLAAAHRTRAPWPVVVVVACLPVVTLGFGAALMHLMHAGEVHPEERPGTVPEPAGEVRETAPADAGAGAPDGNPEPVPAAPEDDAAGRTETAPERAPARPASRTRPAAPRPRKSTAAPGSDEAAEVHYAAMLAAGSVPSMRQIKADLRVGQERASQIRAHLESVAAVTASAGDKDAAKQPT